MRGIFITIEGIEGSGKSTIAGLLAEDISKRGYPVILTREPGGTGTGRMIRQILLDPLHKDIHPLTELLLYFADRAQHIEEVIRPALERGDIVICDRFSDSTIAYQGYGRGIDIGVLKQFDSAVRGGISPDLTILLDLDVRDGLGRNRLTSKNDRFEMEDTEFHEKVRRGYLRISGKDKERVIVINALRPLNEVMAEASRCVDDLMRSKRNTSKGYHK